jgi:hypothetical protein
MKLFGNFMNKMHFRTDFEDDDDDVSIAASDVEPDSIKTSILKEPLEDISANGMTP